MCQYRYYYYAACQHQETVLFDFCEKATPTHLAPSQHPPADKMPPRQVDGSDGMHGGHVIASDTSHLKTPSNTTFSSFTNSVPTRLTSFQEFPRDLSSIQHPQRQHQSRRRRHSEPSYYYSAGLPPLLDTALGHRVSDRKSGVISLNDNPISDQKCPEMERKHLPGSSDRQATRKKQSDDQEGFPSHESPLHDRNTALAISSTLNAKLKALEAEYESMETRINSLKDEVHHMKKQRDEACQRMDISDSCSTECTDGACESAAARLQRSHEADEAALRITTKVIHNAGHSPQTPRSLNPSEFPDLQGSAPRDLSAFTNAVRKASYASIATVRVADAASHFVPPKLCKSSSDPWIDPKIEMTSTASTESWELISPTSQSTVKEPASVPSKSAVDSGKTTRKMTSHVEKGAKIAKSNPASPSRQSTKLPPHFARPTEASCRRTDGTLRKDHTSPTSKLPRANSPVKSMRLSPSSPQRRKGLPGDWLKHTDNQDDRRQRILESTPPKATPKEKTAHQITEMHNALQTIISSQAARSAQKDRTLQKQDTAYLPATVANINGFIANHDLYTAQDSSPTQRRTTPLWRRSSRAGRESFPNLETDRNSSASADSSLDQIIVDPPEPDPYSNLRYRPVASYRPHRSPSDTTPQATVSAQAKLLCGRDSEGSHTLRRHTNPTTPTCVVFDDQADILGLPPVANTKPVRRGSKGHLLQPIRARLSKAGLLNGCADGNGLPKARATSDSGAAGLVKSNRAPPTSMQNVMIQPQTNHNARRLNTATARPDILERKASAQHSLTVSDVTNSISPDKVSSLSQESGRERSSTVPLRPTAQEFVPKVATDATATVQQTWWTLPAGTKINVVSSDPPLPNIAYTEPNESWADNTASHSNYFLEAPVVFHQGFTRNQDDEIRTSPVLNLRLGPGKKTVQWNLQDVNGEESRACFGRAPPPLTPLPPIPDIIPTTTTSTNLTSPPKPNGWSITERTHGWTGGAGREIRYHQKRPSLSSSSSSFSPRIPTGPRITRTSYIPSENRILHDGGIRYFGAGSDSSSPVVFAGRDTAAPPVSQAVVDALPLAPRSMRQWAEKMGSPLVPCGNVKVTHAVEMLPSGEVGKRSPLGMEVAGWCHTCVR